ncbi:tetratricopeptide repeat protein [Marinimicrococcus flavescens]|uniref:Tetratricopeptide repeat protein n=1 Tax=Marinimicrococcus flavescens TaxID=3031815 RepID=A0AAP4D5G8_9PROT|nr:tetratricopeptide repeat protein [Marinimicrococcus flavescens]
MKAEELFREVDEELQRDKLVALWKRWGGLAVGVVLLLVLAGVGWQGWQWWQHRQATEAARGFAAAEQLLAGGKPAEAAAAFSAFAEDAPAGFAALARLQAATAALEAGDRKAAGAALETLAGDEGADPMLRDLAVVLGASLEVDEAPPAGIIARLEPLATETGAWRHLARELIAAAALRAGERSRAVEALEAMRGDAQTPRAARERADELLRALGAEPTRTAS